MNHVPESRNPARGGAAARLLKRVVPGRATSAKLLQTALVRKQKEKRGFNFWLASRPFYSLDERERGAALRPILERYGALPADFIKALGGDKFLPALRALDGESP